MKRGQQINKCPSCNADVIPDSNGDCPDCRRNIIQLQKNPEEELQFYCVVCEDFFFSCRDDTGFDQAPCPTCGDLSCTPDFHVGEMVRVKEDQHVALYWVLKILAILLLSGLGLVIFRSMF